MHTTPVEWIVCEVGTRRYVVVGTRGVARNDAFGTRRDAPIREIGQLDSAALPTCHSNWNISFNIQPLKKLIKNVSKN